MFTRCPGCSTVHPLNAATLAQDGGRYRCGKCSKVSNALDSLFDEWPEPGSKPNLKGELPVLGQAIDLEKAEQSRLDPDDAGLAGEAFEQRRKKSRAGRLVLRLIWLLASLVIGAVIIINVAEFMGRPVVEEGEIEAAKVALGLQEPAPREIFRDLEMIHLVSRKLAANPDRPGYLSLEATLVNRASKPQPYPDLEVILLDTGGDPLASHEFTPDDYLSGARSPESDMSPHAYLPLRLELEDPGELAVGFELNFH